MKPLFLGANLPSDFPQSVENSSASVWYKAMNRLERLFTLCNSDTLMGLAEGDHNTTSNSRCRTHSEILTNWLISSEQSNFDEMPEYVLEVLASAPTEELQTYGVQPPRWLGEVIRAIECKPEPSVLRNLDQGHKGIKEMFDLQKAFSVLLSYGLTQLKQGLNGLAEGTQHAPFVPEKTAENLFHQLLPRVANMISRTMILELNVARLRGQLSGDTPEERFASFITMISDPVVALKILQEYPVLCRQVTIAVRQWIDNSLELMQRLTADWQLIKQMFDVDDPGTLAHVETSAGDSHQNGRTVVILVFDSGFKLVYKPRSMAVDVHFQELLEWVNERGDHPRFKTIKVIDRDSYGWSEFIEAKPCSAREELEHFYERQGGYLALLHTLNAIDFHFENLIAAGEHPVLIDLESLFHAKPKLADHSSGVTDMAAEVLAESVLRVGLLPQRMWGDLKQDEGFEVSGLGGAAGQKSPFRVPAWAGIGTDEMRFERQYIRLPGSKNQPTLGEQPVDVLEFANSIVKGFTAIYSLLVKHHDELLEEQGPVAQFTNDEIRYIARPTRFYALSLVDSFHPDFLRDALDRDTFFDHLRDSATQRLELSKLVEFERADLWRNDIPFFTSTPGSCRLLSSTKESIEDYFESTSLDAVRKRLHRMDEEDCKQQCWLIRSSLTALAMGEPTASWQRYNLEEEEREVDCERLLQGAKVIGDRLVELALKDKQEVTWLGLSLVRERFWQVAPMNLGLYDGVAGVALFLSYLGAVTNEPTYTHIAEDATSYIHKQWGKFKEAVANLPQLSIPVPIGAFSHSPVSAIYLLTHLGQLWRAEELLTEAESLVGLLPDFVDRDESFDVLFGAAGCIRPLLNLQAIRSSDQTMELALKCGGVLLKEGMPMTTGIGWKTMSGSEQPLAGFSHGAAGIAWALMQLGHYTGESRFIDCAKEAIAYERSLFDPEAGNWPDLRENSRKDQGKDEEKDVKQSASPEFMTAWCHGAPGIGLSRLDLLMKYGPDPEIEAEVEIAIRTTRASGFGMNHSLCHGDLGNLELLFNAAKAFGDPVLEKEVARVLGGVLDSAEQHGWLCGVPLAVETPGLMTGIAGIGYQLLRFAAPERVPSVLLLEAPPA
jgi:type 2 lantibiotic biosynthesis protein LanM